MPNGDTVRVINPADGKVYVIPQGNLSKALSGGWSKAPDPHVSRLDPGSYQSRPGGPILQSRGGTLRSTAQAGLHGVEEMLGVDPREVAKEKTTMGAMGAAYGGAASGALKMAGKTLMDPFTPLHSIASGVESSIADIEAGHKHKDPRSVAHGIGTAVGASAQEKLTEAGGKLVKSAASPIASVSRAREGFERVSQQATHLGVKVDSISALAKALEAEKLSKQGFTMPKPMSDFLARIKNWRVQGLNLSYEEARNFVQSLGSSIPWDQYGGKGGKMFGLAKAMRAALDSAINTSLKQTSPELAETYKTAKSDFRKGMKTVKYGKFGAGAVGGALGYELGERAGHPWLGAFVGMKAGKSAGGPIMKWLVEPY